MPMPVREPPRDEGWWGTCVYRFNEACQNESEILCQVQQRQGEESVELPKGGIQPKDDSNRWRCAKRETWEEAGVWLAWRMAAATPPSTHLGSIDVWLAWRQPDTYHWHVERNGGIMITQMQVDDEEYPWRRRYWVRYSQRHMIREDYRRLVEQHVPPYLGHPPTGVTDESRRQELCRHFLRRSGCRHGDNCKYLHRGQVLPDLCHRFQRGQCTKGNRCRFRHVDEE